MKTNNTITKQEINKMENNNTITINYFGHSNRYGKDVKGKQILNHGVFCKIFNDFLQTTKPQYKYKWIDENDYELHKEYFNNFKYECFNTYDTDAWMNSYENILKDGDFDVLDLIHDFVWTLHEEDEFPYLKDSRNDNKYIPIEHSEIIDEIVKELVNEN